MKFLHKYKYFLLTTLFILFTDILLFSFGQPFKNKNGAIQFWCGTIASSCNSQDISDWYTPSHFLHGVIFFWFFYLLFSFFFSIKKSLNFINTKTDLIHSKILLLMFSFSLLLECFWEVLENTPFIINKYREGTIAFDYSGDSILNSTFDIIFMTLGFLFAKKFGWKISLLIFIILELFTLYFIKDNLTLNVLMLLYPLEIIKDWQMS
jgi:hypothetical protein